MISNDTWRISSSLAAGMAGRMALIWVALRIEEPAFLYS